VTLRAADPKLGLIVGMVMIPVLLALIAYFLVIRDKIFLRPTVTVRVYFVHVGALKEGAPVIVAGRRVGTIQSIQLLPLDSERPDDPMDGVGGAVAIVRIDRARRSMVPINGDFFVAAKGIFSDRYLEVGPPRGDADPGRPVENGDKVRGIDPPSMDRVLQNTWNNLTITREFLASVEPQSHALFAALDELSLTLATLETVPGDLATLRDRVDAVTTEARTTWLTLEAGGARPEDLGGLATHAQVVLDQAGLQFAVVRLRIDRLLTDLDRARAQLETARPGLEKKIRTALLAADRAFGKIDDVRAKVADLMGILARGEGTMGRLANDPEFPEDAKELGKILKRTPWRVVGHPQDDLAP
jgi:ABC-type transporter Mla subunit MlaD